MTRPLALLWLAATLAAPAAAAAVPAKADMHTRAWDLAHLGPDGVEKCRAFRAIEDHAMRLQKGDGGALPAVWRRRLESDLARAKAMPPRGLSARTCGTAL